ncbi:MAG: SGNH/GDSL hydrolase family protein [Lentisphaeria bacterium]|nr:SGNH/GDSL hydrolase family protein [Lentisphaeria bacterium]
MAEYKVYNAGFPGDTTLELLKRFNRDAAQHQPDVVVLLVGSNDMFYPGHILDLATYEKNLNAPLDRINNINARAILLTAPRFLKNLLIENFPETINHPVSLDDRLEMLNDTIRQTADRRDIPLVDIFRFIDPVDETASSLVMNPANSNRRDGMHMTGEGCKVIAENVYKAVKTNYPEAKTVVCLGDSITYGVYMTGKGSADIDADTYPGQLCKMLNKSC